MTKSPADAAGALSAGMVKRAEDWPWGSLWARTSGDERQQAWLSEWPVDRPRDWTRAVSAAISAREQEVLRTCMARNRPYGDAAWQTRTANRLGLAHTLRAEGRPRKKPQRQKIGGHQDG